jgi:glycosyltransferase involved in cell wall biosynthesis
MPRVSVIIPCYNYARFLQDAVGSVLRQTFQDFEIIIVNDGSPDNTAEVAEDIVRNNPGHEIRLVNQVNMGVSAARNAGISAARGEYILPLDADDMLMPDFLDKLVPYLENNPDLDLVYSWSKSCGIRDDIEETYDFTCVNLIRNMGPSCSALFRKSAWAKAGGYNPVMRDGYEDWDFSCRLYEDGGRGEVVKQPLLLYRKHGISRNIRAEKFAVSLVRDLKLLHPRMFEPGLCRINISLAKAVIWIKYFSRDRVMRWVYVNMPGLHKVLSRFKYDVYMKWTRR